MNTIIFEFEVSCLNDTLYVDVDVEANGQEFSSRYISYATQPILLIVKNQERFNKTG